MNLRTVALSNPIARSHISGIFVLAAVLALTALIYPALGQQKVDNQAVASGTASSTPLDGLTFSAGIVRAEDEEKKPLDDVLTFKDGQFSSEVCRRYNFASAPYWIRRDGDQVHFLAELTSPTDGKMLWQGSIRDGKLEGTMRWTRKRWYWTIDAEHNIRGKVKDVPEQGASE